MSGANGQKSEGDEGAAAEGESGKRLGEANVDGGGSRGGAETPGSEAAAKLRDLIYDVPDFNTRPDPRLAEDARRRYEKNKEEYEEGWRKEGEEEMQAWAELGVRAVEAGVIDKMGVVLFGPHSGCEPIGSFVMGFEQRVMEKVAEKSYGRFSSPEMTVDEAVARAVGEREFGMFTEELKAWTLRFASLQVEIMNRWIDKTEEGLQKVEARAPHFEDGEIGELSLATKELAAELRVFTARRDSGDEDGRGRGKRVRALGLAGLGLVLFGGGMMLQAALM